MSCRRSFPSVNMSVEFRRCLMVPNHREKPKASLLFTRLGFGKNYTPLQGSDAAGFTFQGGKA